MNRLRLGILVLFAVAAPLAFTSRGTVVANTACATGNNGSCCLLLSAICGLNGQNYTGRDYHTGSC